MEKPSSLRMTRLGRGWSQEQLAMKAGVSQSTVSFVERGIAVGAESLEKVTKALSDQHKDGE